MDKNNIQIEIIDVKVEQVPAKTGGKTYTQMTVSHIDLSTGKSDGKKLVEYYTDKALWSALVGAKRGQVFNLERGKNDKGYWDWKSVSVASGEPPAQADTQAKPVTKNTYEVNNEINRLRFEHDIAKQPLIVRQSCLSSAATVAKPGTDPQEVIKIAQQFVDWVEQKAVKEMAEDVPF